MFANTSVPEALKERYQKHVLQAITPEQGIDAFRRILASSLRQVVISKHHLPTEIKQSYSKIYLEQEFTKIQNKSSNANLSQSLYSRPNLGNDYIAPVSKVEKTITHIWQNILGVEQIGIHDNFFELGGNSLMSIQVINQLKKELNIKIPVVSIYERPTISSLAEIISSNSQEEKFDQHYSRGKNRRESKMRSQRH
jgi:acyl carrier protein